MHRVATASSGHVDAPVAATLFLVLMTLALAGAPDVLLARTIRFLAFDAQPNAAYDARLNGAMLQTIASSQLGTLDYAFNASNGNLIGFVPASLAPPPAPLLSTVVAEGVGCARATWALSGDPTVVGYVVYAGTRSVASGAATQYDIAVNAGSVSNMLVCPLLPGVNYVALRSKNYAGVLSAYSTERSVTIAHTPVGVGPPTFKLELRQNVPNPFNPVTRIPFTLDRAQRVVIRVYDVRGELVATLQEGQLVEGHHTASWNGTDDRGRPVASGIYIYALTTDRGTISRKMNLIK